MNIEDRQYYKHNLKRLRRKDGKPGKPPMSEILEAEKEMIKFRELINKGKVTQQTGENFKPLVNQPISIAEILRKAQDAGH